MLNIYTEEIMEIYKVINEVHKELAKKGIQKGDKNKFDNYMYRGIDSVYNTVSPILAKHGLLILQRVLSLDTVERASQKGGILFFSTIEVEFDLIAASDGSKHTIKTFGEGMDRSDKSINKALTAAYKYALFQAFCIPVESTDPDNETLLPGREVKHVQEIDIMEAVKQLTSATNLEDLTKSFKALTKGHPAKSDFYTQLKQVAAKRKGELNVSA